MPLAEKVLEKKSGKRGTTKGKGEEGIKLPPEAEKTEFSLMGNVIKARAAEQLGVEKRDIDFNEETGLITVWTNDPYNRKMFYQTSVISNKVTTNSLGKKFYFDKTYKFTFRGSKL